MNQLTTILDNTLTCEFQTADFTFDFAIK